VPLWLGTQKRHYHQRRLGPISERPRGRPRLGRRLRQTQRRWSRSPRPSKRRHSTASTKRPALGVAPQSCRDSSMPTKTFKLSAKVSSDTPQRRSGAPRNGPRRGNHEGEVSGFWTPFGRPMQRHPRNRPVWSMTPSTVPNKGRRRCAAGACSWESALIKWLLL
jgi:hypothetical protein